MSDSNGRTCGIGDSEAEAIGSALADAATPDIIGGLIAIEQDIVNVAEIVSGVIDPSIQK